MNRKLSVIMAVGLTLVMALSLSACIGGSKADNKGAKADPKKAEEVKDIDLNGDPFVIYQTAQNRMSDAAGVSMDMDMDISTEILGESYETTTVGPIITNRPSEDSLEMKMEQTTSGTGEDDIVTTSYYKDGYLYTDMAGSKIKQEMSIDDALETASYSMPLLSSWVKDKSSAPVDGGVEVSLVLDGSAISDLIAPELAELGEEADDATIGDATITAVVLKDGSLASQILSMKISLTVEGMSLDMNFVITLSNIKVSDSAIKIDFPTDLDSYTES
jgi:hypothetical protein